MPGAETTFTLIEWLAITGFAQCMLILVYMLFRVGPGQFSQAFLPIVYFSVLALAFALQLSLRLEDIKEPLEFALWLAWAMGPPLSYLLIIQVAELTRLPPARDFWALVLIPFAVLGAGGLIRAGNVCDKSGALVCEAAMDWYYVLGAVAGAIGMFAIVAHKDLLGRMVKTRGGKERFWLVIVLIVSNVAVLAIHLLRTTPAIPTDKADMIRTALGLGFAYLASTILFRIYPTPVQLSRRRRSDDLTVEEEDLARKIRQLMQFDKLYHEPTFSRADLARELEVSEGLVSKIINVSFGKSFPQLLNEHRVEDAKRMLVTSEAPIRVIAFEVGFNSLASFNRVFREVTGTSPSSYRSEESEGKTA